MRAFLSLKTTLLGGVDVVPNTTLRGGLAFTLQKLAATEYRYPEKLYAKQITSSKFEVPGRKSGAWPVFVNVRKLLEIKKSSSKLRKTSPPQEQFGLAPPCGLMHKTRLETAFVHCYCQIFECAFTSATAEQLASAAQITNQELAGRFSPSCVPV